MSVNTLINSLNPGILGCSELCEVFTWRVWPQQSTVWWPVQNDHVKFTKKTNFILCILATFWLYQAYKFPSQINFHKFLKHASGRWGVTYWLLSFQSTGSKSSLDYKNKLNIFSIDHSIGTPSLPSINSSTRDVSSFRSLPSVGAMSTSSSRLTLESQV